MKSKIRLVPLTLEFVNEKYVNWLNDPEVNQFLESRFTVHTLASTAKYVENMIASEGNKIFAILDSQSESHIGNIRLGLIDFHHLNAGVGIMIGDKNFHGVGAGTAAIQTLIQYVIQETEIIKLFAGCYASNIGSRKSFLKCGFKIEGELKNHVYRSDGKRDDLLQLGYEVNR